MLFISGVASAQQDIINNYAGGGPNNVPATSAPTAQPTSVAYDNAGNYYFSTNYTNQHRVFKVSTSGTLTVLAGEGSPGYSGDGGLATEAQLYYPQGIAVDSQGNVFIADEYNHIIREVIASTGFISTVAGQPQSAGYISDGVPATTTDLYYPSGVAIDNEGNLVIADQYDHRIRLVACITKTSTGGSCTPPSGDTTGDIYTIAGDGTNCSTQPCGDGGLATSATLYYPYAVATDSSGNVYISDTYDQRIRRVACGSGISGCTVHLARLQPTYTLWPAMEPRAM
jgi:hypothetical protein